MATATENRPAARSATGVSGPTIVCPEWCEVGYEHHFAELQNWDGSVIHASKVREVDGGSLDVTHSRLPFAWSSGRRWIKRDELETAMRVWAAQKTREV